MWLKTDKKWQAMARSALEIDDAPTGKRRSWNLIGVTALALFLCVGLVVGMAALVTSEFDELSTANSDNLQWSLAQTDVEFLRLQLALERSDGDPSELSELRRRFDVFYSRFATLTEGQVFSLLHQLPQFVSAEAQVKAFLDASVPLIDGSDPELLAAVPELLDQSYALNELVRQLSLSGLVAFAEVSDEQRANLVESLILMALVLAGLFAGLVLLAFALFRLGKLAENRTSEAQNAAARLRTIVETSLDAIIVISSDGKVLELNPAAIEMFRRGLDAAIGRNAIRLLFPPAIAETLRAEDLNFIETNRRPGRHERRLETTAIDSQGHEFPAEMSVDRADTGNGDVFVAYIRDISRRKKAEEALTVALDQALAGERAKAEFLAVMSHEMRTPLNGLLGTMSLLRDHIHGAKQIELLNVMQSSGKMLLSLVNDVLDLAKFESGKMTAKRKAFSVSDLLNGVVETAASLASANDNELSWAWVGNEADCLVGDARGLRQILLNLVGNAVKFTHGGSVDIELELTGGKQKHLEIRVTDTGNGIAEDDLLRVFNDFETLDSSYARQAGGTGLGLGIARRMTELMGGEIGAESVLDDGSVFWLRVPIEIGKGMPARARPATAKPAETKVPQGMDLLLVEDNEVNRFVAREMLKARGHKVTEANDGRAGVEQAEAHKFDAILMDISMPIMDGIEATRCIRAGNAASATTPIIAVTAHALPEEVERFREAGMDFCISKPINRSALLDMLDAIAAGKDSTPSPSAPPAPSERLIDEDLLGVLWSEIGADTGAQLLNRFKDDTAPKIAMIATTALSGQELISIVHECAGSCGTFGLVALREKLSDIETRARRQEQIADDAMTGLALLWRDSLDALDAWRRQA